MKLMLFNVMVMQVIYYGAEVWGGTISSNAWNEIGILKDGFKETIVMC